MSQGATKHHPHGSSPRHGFTLLETLLAISLSAVLLVLVGAAINLYARLVADRRSDVVNAQVARAILHRIAGDLRATYHVKQEGGGPTEEEGAAGDELDGEQGSELDDPLTGDSTGADASSPTFDPTSSTVQVTPGLYGNEFELQMDVWGRFAPPVKYDMLAAAGLDPQSANLWSDPKIVTYYLRPSSPSELVGTPIERFDAMSTGDRNVLIRRVQSRAQATYSAAAANSNDMQQGEQLLSDQVVALWFEYFDGLEWLTQWDTEVDAGLPRAVRITIVVVDAEAAPAGSPVDAMDSTNPVEGDTYQMTVSLPTAEAPATDDSTL